MEAPLPDDLVALPTAPWDERPTELPLDIEECRTALWLCRGNITDAAAMLKVKSARLRRFVNDSEYLTREQNESREILQDIAEGNVYEALTDKQDPGRRDSMSRFVLERLGKARGFGSGTAGISVGGLKGKGRLLVAWDTEEAPAPIDVTPKAVTG
jgi:hypothetical protein